MATTNTKQSKAAEQQAGQPTPGDRSAVETQSPGYRSAERIRQLRRQRWQWNGRLLAWTAVVVVVVMALSAGSYVYHSKQTASSFLLRAEQAAAEGDYSQQARWLRRYSLLKPDDVDAVVDAAIAADQAADNAASGNHFASINNARKQLSTALARLSAEEDHQRITDLRSRLIERLLQLGSYWSREAERQVILLDAEREDPQATKWLAQALIRQISAELHIQRIAPTDEDQPDYWNWLASQPLGDVLTLALQRNPGDLDLIANVQNLLQQQPELFHQGHDLVAQEKAAYDMRKALDRAIETIRDNPDSRSQLIVYQLHKGDGQDSVAKSGLLTAAEAAFQRLDALATAEDAVQSPPSTGGEIPEQTWDYFLLLEAAKTMALEEAPEPQQQAEKWLELLTSLQLPAVPPSASENAFLTAGLLQQRKGSLEKAIAVWEQGLQQVNPNSLLLLWPLGNAYSQRDSDEQAAEAVERFGKAIETAKTHWLRTTVNEASRAERTALGRQLEAATWRHSALRAFLSIREGQRIKAIDQMTSVLSQSSDVAVDASERLRVASALAELCKAEGLWDRAATAYESAIAIDPQDPTLRAAAAEAWTRSGNRMQAMEHWRLAGNSDLLSLQLQSANALFDYQLRVPPSQRDFSAVRGALERLRRNLPEDQDLTDQTQRHEVALARRRLEILGISIPPPGLAVEKHLRSEKMADEVAKLAEKYPEDPTIQAFAAERLAATGNDERAKQALAQVATITGPSPTLTILQARVEAELNGPSAAGELLLEHAERHPAHRINLMTLAASYAAKANDPQQAYRALTKIPENQRNATVLMMLAEMAQSLPSDAEVLHKEGQNLTPTKLASQWEKRLRELEGDSGAYWRYLKAKRIMSRLNAQPQPLAQDNPDLEEARLLIRDVLASRPRWGEAIALEGWLSILQGKPEQAVQQLRRGIAAGDTRLQTRQRLVEQLYRLERYAEAEQEISAAAMSSEIAIDKYSTTRIGLLQLQGDYQRSLAIAEAAAGQSPNDFISHLVLSVTASKAAAHSDSEELRSTLESKARTALATASELADENEPRIFAARLQVELAHGDEASVRAEIANIQNSELDDYSKLTLESQALVLLKDYEAAVPLLERAEKMKPSTRTQFALAELYRQMQRYDEQIKLLRAASARNPNNEGLRNDLAQALVARDGEDVDWKELADLLSTAKDATANNRFLYAMLLGSRGSAKQQLQAERILRELIEEQNQSSLDAKRFLAILLRKRLNTLDDGTDSAHEEIVAEIQSLYQNLTLQTPPAMLDIFRYADFLLDAQDPEYLPQVRSLRDKLRRQYPGTLPALELSIRYAVANDEQDTTPKLVRAWMGAAIAGNTLNEANAATVAGSTLLNLGFFEEATEWLQKAYQNNTTAFTNYVLALNRSGKSEKSIDLCVAHFEEHQDATSATLLVESLLTDREKARSPQFRMLILQALDRFANHAPLLESVATLRLQQNDPQEAISLYERARKLAPDRIRTLNNLAMAYCEVPGQASKGIELIDRAIELNDRDPELRDTKGLVLLKAGKPDQAEVAFQAAIDRSSDPRFLFHLIIALMDQQQRQLAKAKWKTLDLERLDLSRLTQDERERLDTLKNEFGEPVPDTTLAQEDTP